MPNMEKQELTIEQLHEFLEKIIKADKVGIRRKLVALRRFLDEHLGKNYRIYDKKRKKIS